MATFLKLCQDVALESGTIPTLGDPQTVTAQTGRLNRIIYFTGKAYDDIQANSDMWRWLHGEFEGATIANVVRYESTGLGIASRFAHWIGLDSTSWSIYDPATGKDGEVCLSYVSWDDFYTRLTKGEVTTGMPTTFSIDPQNKVALYPTPDKAYAVRGRHYKDNQSLTDDTDVPEMPARFHDAIKWRALVLLATFDESFAQVQNWDAFYQPRLSALRHDQLPRLSMPGPLV